MQIAGIEFDPPDHVPATETVMTFHLPTSAPDSAGKALLHSNLIVRSRVVSAALGLEVAAGELCAELRHLGTAVQDLSHGEVVFADDVRGILVAYDFVRGASLLRQYHALRLDDRCLTTLVLTVAAGLDPEIQRGYVDALCTARRAEAAA